MDVSDRIFRDVGLLHPVFRPRVLVLERMAKHAFATRQIPCALEVFETWRSPSRQARLYAEKRTKVSEWGSAHQFGLAADFVPRIDGRWTWDDPRASETFDWLRANAASAGLRNSITWDRPHCELPEWPNIRNALRLAGDSFKPSGV